MDVPTCVQCSGLVRMGGGGRREVRAWMWARCGAEKRALHRGTTVKALENENGWIDRTGGRAGGATGRRPTFIFLTTSTTRVQNSSYTFS